MCLGCRRLRRSARLTCDAFPDGVPPEIITSTHDHRLPFAGDWGLLYWPRTEADAREVEERFEGRERTGTIPPGVQW